MSDFVIQSIGNSDQSNVRWATDFKNVKPLQDLPKEAFYDRKVRQTSRGSSFAACRQKIMDFVKRLFSIGWSRSERETHIEVLDIRGVGFSLLATTCVVRTVGQQPKMKMDSGPNYGAFRLATTPSLRVDHGWLSQYMVHDMVHDW